MSIVLFFITMNCTLKNAKLVAAGPEESYFTNPVRQVEAMNSDEEQNENVDGQQELQNVFPDNWQQLVNMGFEVDDDNLPNPDNLAPTIVGEVESWPKGINGDLITEHLNMFQVGQVNALLGTKQGRSFYVFALKEPDYNMLIMSTYGDLKEVPSAVAKQKYTAPGCNEPTSTTFNYTTTFANHYKY
jgi:hypothetical protein